ncbi:MAG: ABC transporter ATP-binding protein/permease [Bacilli bacterium]|nr:ABC transporter ATP-binding protein/permease [Bacilli bacterium]
MKNLGRIKRYIKGETKKIVFTLILVLFFVGASMSQPYLIGKALDEALANNYHAFLTYVITCIILAAVGIISGYLFERLVNKFTHNIVYKMRIDVFNKINSIPYSYFSNHSSGSILQFEIVDIENITNGLISLFKYFIEGGLTIIVTIILMFILNWLLAIGVILLSPLSIFVARFISNRNHKYFVKQFELQSNINALSKECIENLDLIQSNNYELQFIEKYKKSNNILRKHGNLALFSASWVNPSTRLVNNIIYALIGVIGIVIISIKSDIFNNLNAMISIGGLASFLVYINQYTKPFNEISSAAIELENARTSFERICAFLNQPDDKDEGIKEVTSIHDISFEHINFSYNKKQSLIEEFSLDITHGRKIAIVGPTGAGKSTLINLVLRYFDIDGGDLKYDGISYRELSKKTIRNNIGFVLQEPWVFKGTIFDNIRYAKQDATNEEIIDVCKKANIDKFINLLPFGYDTIVSSKNGLSEGEKQLISIARLMLAEPNIVVLDEATSNIDTRSEKMINDAFDKIMENKTSIVIAHRLSTIVSADVILVIKNGKIVEKGNHKDLMNKHGFYYELYSSQFDSVS